MTRDEANSILMKGLDCAQTVFYSFAEDVGIDSDLAQRVSAGFGGGMFTGETCGAVTGSIMALGVKYGHSIPVDQQSKDEFTDKVLEFKRRFVEKCGSCMCRDLLGADCSTPEGMKKIEEEGLHDKICPGLVAEASNILEDLIYED